MTKDEYRTKCQFARKGAIIYNAENGKPTTKRCTYDSINMAKRWVREHAPQTTFVIE